MSSYVARRLLLVPVTLLAVSIAVFVVLRVLPGDVARVILGQGGEGTYTEEQYLALRSELGLDHGIVRQYVDWSTDLVTFDLGESYTTHRSVSEEIGDRLPFTLELAVLAWVSSVVLGVPLGVLMALYRDRWPDYVLRFVSIAGLAAPPYWVGALALAGSALYLEWNPPIGSDPWESLGTNLQLFLLPAIVIALYFMGLIARMTRSALLEVLGEDYMRTAWAKGLGQGLAIRRHALKNALIPVVTVSGYQFGNLLSGALVIELVFALPGVGRLLFDAVQARDYPVVQAAVLLSALVFLVSNLLVDLAYAYLDPRVRYRADA